MNFGVRNSARAQYLENVFGSKNQLALVYGNVGLGSKTRLKVELSISREAFLESS